MKLGLKAKDREGKATTLQSKNYEVLKYSTSKLYLITIIGLISEEILQEKLADPYTWRFRSQVIQTDLSKLIFAWKEVVEAILPLVASQITGNAYDAVRAFSENKPLSLKVSALIQATGSLMTQRFAPLKDKTMW